MDLERTIAEFQDHLAPRLDTYEQTIYLYLFRHSRLLGDEEVTVGFKSARTRMAMGIGKAGSPMAEGRCREKLQSLAAKGCVSILDSTRTGTRVRVHLPDEVEGVVPTVAAELEVPIEDMDFFDDPSNRALILEREGHRCFYCMRKLNDGNHVIEHVVSRPDGDNSYKNVVAACRQCNNRKSDASAEDFMRLLYRENFLASEDFEARFAELQRLKAGELKPVRYAS